MNTLRERLIWARAEKGARDGREFTQGDLAAKVGVTQGNIAHLESGRTLTSRKCVALAQALGVEPGWLAGGKGEPFGRRDEGVSPTTGDRRTGDRRAAASAQSENQSTVEGAPAIVGALKRLPVVGRVQAGPDGSLSIDDYPTGHGDGYMLWWSTCPSAYALRVRGESMSPRYLPGEFVGVDPCADPAPSDEVIVQLKNGQSMIKRLLWRRDDQACFESVNKNFQNIVLDLEDIDKLHLVLGNIPKAAFRSE